MAQVGKSHPENQVTGCLLGPLHQRAAPEASVCPSSDGEWSSRERRPGVGVGPPARQSAPHKPRPSRPAPACAPQASRRQYSQESACSLTT